MKNISRRVFIKGMAVAAAATAASTVLAGCKVNPVEPEVEPTPAQTAELNDSYDDDKAITVTSTGFGTVSQLSYAAVSLKLVNDLASNVTIEKVTVTAADTYRLIVSAYGNGDKKNAISLVHYAANEKDLWGKVVTANNDITTVTKEGNLYFDYSSVKDCTKITVVMQLYKGDGNIANLLDEAEFNYSL